MKRQFFTGLTAIFTIGFLFVSCSVKSEKDTEIEQEKTPNLQNLEIPTGDQTFIIPMPEGTSFREHENANGDIDKIDFRLPADYTFYGVTSNGKLISDNSGSIKCLCSENDKCRLFSTSGKMGSLSQNGSTCTQVSTLKQKGELSMFFIRNGAQAELSEESAFSDTRPMYEPEEWVHLPFPTKEEVESEEFQEALTGLLNPSKSATKNNNNLVAVAVVVKGKKILMNVSFDELEPGCLYTNSISPIKYNCTGSCKGESCKFITAASGQIAYCYGCNSGCVLSIAK